MIIGLKNIMKCIRMTRDIIKYNINKELIKFRLEVQTLCTFFFCTLKYTYCLRNSMYKLELVGKQSSNIDCFNQRWNYITTGQVRGSQNFLKHSTFTCYLKLYN